jgi:hypothetical protein
MNDETLNDLVASIRENNEKMTDEERAYLDARIAYRQRPLDERMLEAAFRMTKAECGALRDQLRALAVKDTLTDEDKAEMRRLREATEDHPSGVLLDQLLPLRGRGPHWLDDHITEVLWGWAWWADRFGMGVRDYMQRPGGLVEHPEEHVQAVFDVLPYPEGWKPETRR